MEDNKPKTSRKRRRDTPNSSSKRRRIDPPTAQEPPPQAAEECDATLLDDLLRCLRRFIRKRCHKLKHLSSKKPIHWLKKIDHTMTTKRHQDESFLTPASVVFMYMMCRDLLSSEIDSKRELKATVCSCFYVSYSFIGSETIYPRAPFLVRRSKQKFWDRCLSYINQMSSKMISIKTDRQFYNAMLCELKIYGI